MHLSELGIANPCDQPLEAMGAMRDPSARFCSSCQERVVDLSRLTRAQAESVLRRGECVSAVYDDAGQIVFRPERRGLPVIAPALRAAAVAAPLWLLGCRGPATTGTSSDTEQTSPIVAEPALAPSAAASAGPEPEAPEPEPEAECELAAPAVPPLPAAPADSAGKAVRPGVVASPPVPKPPQQRPRLGGKPAYHAPIKR